MEGTSDSGKVVKNDTSGWEEGQGLYIDDVTVIEHQRLITVHL